MNWKDVSVWQMQCLSNLLSKKEDDDTELDIAVKSLAILSNRTESQIDSLSIKDLNAQLKSIEFITKTNPNPKPVKYINVNGKRYKCIYDIRNMPYARYMETKFFGDDVLNNLHKIAASMIIPMKKTWLGWREDKYDASKHEQYANDILEASYESIYGSIVFFCQVYIQSIKNLADYLKETLMMKGMTKEESEEVIQTLCNDLDGFINVPLLPNMKGLN